MDPPPNEVSLPLDLHRDGVVCGASTRIGDGAGGFVRVAHNSKELERTLLYPLHVVARRVRI